MKIETVAASRGQRIVRRRVARGYSQEELARRIGCSARTIQRIESGATDEMHQRIRSALSEHLGIPLRMLANGQRVPGRG